MKNLFRNAVLATGALAVTAGSAIANPSTWTNNGRQYVVIEGLNEGDRIELSLSNQDEVRSATVDACGWVKLSETTTYPIATNVALSSDGGLTYGANIDLTALSTFELTCDTTTGQVKAGGTVTTPPTQNFIDGRGRRVIVGQTPTQKMKVRYNGTPDRLRRKANSCGYVQMTDSDRTDLSAFVYNGTSYTLAGLPSQNPPTSKTVAGQRVCYAPVP